MTGPSEPIGSMLQGTLSQLRKLAQDGPAQRVDRTLGALTFAAAAAVLAWPPGRKPPKALAASLELATEIWKRRSWWMPTS